MNRASVHVAVAGASAALGVALRERGLPTTVDEERAFAEALAALDIDDRDQVRWAARAVFLRDPAQGQHLEAVFDRFWRGLRLDGPVTPIVEHGESDPRMPGPQHGGESLPQFRLSSRSGRLLDGAGTRAGEEIPIGGAQEQGEGARRGVLAAYSPLDTETNPQRLEFGSDELAAVRRLGEELRRAHPQRISRRRAPCRRRGALDVRRTVRESLRTDGEALRPVWTGRSLRPRRVVLICDVSGSMERYARVLLAGLQAAVAAGIRAEAFAFATRLTRLTTELRDRDLTRGLERARGRVGDWSGGTRIGEALERFNRVHGRRGVSRGAMVIIVSDGWDRGDPARLARETRRLQLHARRLIWVNPRPGDLGMQPLAVGMRAALPHLDHYVPGADPAAIVSLIPFLDGLGPGRPARRSRPVDSPQALTHAPEETG